MTFQAARVGSCLVGLQQSYMAHHRRVPSATFGNIFSTLLNTNGIMLMAVDCGRPADTQGPCAIIGIDDDMNLNKSSKSPGLDVSPSDWLHAMTVVYT